MSENVGLAEVAHMARLSRLSIDEAEARLFARQFGEILNHMNKLRALDTEGVEPMFSPLDRFAPTREDRPERLRSTREILANAPETDGEAFVVPRIV